MAAKNRRSTISKGGRGKKTPYQTTHVRVPLPIKAKIEKQINDFRQSVDKGDVIVDDFRLFNQIPLFPSVDYDGVLGAIDRFIDEQRLGEFLTIKNNVRLIWFRQWVEQQISKEKT